MNKPLQIIGYWGENSTANLIILQKILANQSKPFCLKNSHIWGIGYWGINQPPKYNNQSLLVNLTASGIDNFNDAWVKIKNDNLILGRGIFGQIPLYWCKINQTIWFSSKFTFLLTLLKNFSKYLQDSLLGFSTTLEINLQGLYGYTCFSYFPNPDTPIKEIQAISAGKEQIWQNINNFDIKILHQWQSYPKTITNETKAVTNLRKLLEESIEKQIQDIGNQTVGIFLSGGLDSAIVTAILKKFGIKIRAYTLDFGKYGISETSYAQIVANHLDIPLIKVKITPKKVKEILLNTVTALDIPFGDGVTVPLYLLSEIASKEVQIVFNGENGDQLFAGWTNKPIIAASIYNSINPNLEQDFTQQYLKTFHRLWGYENKIFQPSIYQQISNYSPEKWLDEALDSQFTTSLLDRLRRATLMLKGTQNIQPRATNLAQYHNLWLRSPFCDLALSEWTFSVTPELFLQGACEKYILKKAVCDLLPPDIIWREKRGMGVPLTDWCLQELWQTLGLWLNQNNLKKEGIFNDQLPFDIIFGKLSGNIRNRRIGENLWLLLIWEIWRSHFLSNNNKQFYLSNSFLLPYQVWKILLSNL
jgi:asparagine synthase (glutamine-hydrolysing)